MKENADDQRASDDNCVQEQMKVIEMIKKALDYSGKTAELGVRVEHITTRVDGFERRVDILERDYHKTAIAISNMEANLKTATDIIPRIEPILSQLIQIVAQTSKIKTLAIKFSFWFTGGTILCLFLLLVLSVVSSEVF